MSEPQQSHSPDSYDDEIDLREVLGFLWAGKWVIGGVTFTAAVIAVVVALMLPNIYRAEALLAPNDQEGAGGLSALASQYGGLASLAGLNIGNGGTNDVAVGLQILQSRKFISEFVQRRDLLVPLMAAKRWNRETRKLEIDSHAYNVSTGQWVRDVPEGRDVIPTAQEAYKTFRDALSVRQDRKSGLVTISLEHYSPEVAKQWVDWLVSDINLAIMRRDVADAEQAIEYLNKQIENTSVAALQNVFFRLIEEQTKTVMLANVSDEYLLRTLDPAIVPEKRSKPNRRLVVIFGTMLGGLLGIAIAVVRSRKGIDR